MILKFILFIILPLLVIAFMPTKKGDGHGCDGE